MILPTGLLQKQLRRLIDMKKIDNLEEFFAACKEIKIICSNEDSAPVAKFLIKNGFFILAGENYVMGLLKNTTGKVDIDAVE